jgi:hypothetical protein
MYSRVAEDLPERFGKEERLRWAWDARMAEGVQGSC